MFTGIVTNTAVIDAAQQAPGGDLQVTLAFDAPERAIGLGESIAVNGCCLTAIRPEPEGARQASFTLSCETLARTAPRWRVGERANIERSLRVGEALSGHFVSGHVDGTATLLTLDPLQDSTRLTLEAPESLARFIAEKGSVTLDGVSLTINRVDGARFELCIIPHTWAATSLRERKPGDALNLEIDLLARYAARLAMK